MSVISYIIDHYRELFEVAMAAHLTAALIVNLTPTPKDDEVVAKVYRALEIVAGLITPLAKR